MLYCTIYITYILRIYLYYIYIYITSNFICILQSWYGPLPRSVKDLNSSNYRHLEITRI